VKPEKGVLYFLNNYMQDGYREAIIIGPLIPVVDVADNISGVNRVEFYLNYELLRADDTPPYTCIVSGNYFKYHCILEITVFDDAGRNATEQVTYISYSLGLLRP
jgi:hypothetical protein